MKEAKDFILSQISKGLLNKEELTDPNSSYNKIKKMTEDVNQTGYMPFFVRQHYNNPKDITIKNLEILLDYLIKVKKLNKSLDVSKYAKGGYLELLNDCKGIVEGSKLGSEMPGFIVHEHADAGLLAVKLNKYDYYVIVCVKKQAGKWIPDHQTLINWGSPRWCIKKSDYWKENQANQYLKTLDHIQYVIIHQNMYPLIIEAAKQKDKAKQKLVPVNYGSNYEDADNYKTVTVRGNDSTKYRFGLTTNPAENNNFFQHRESIICFDDGNGSVGNIERFSEMSNGFPIRLVDIEVRKILGLKRSEFDVSVPTFEEIIKFIDYKATKKADELIKLCGNFVSIMEKAQAKSDEYPQLQAQISSYILKKLNVDDPENIFYSMMYVILYADNVDDKLIKVLENLFLVKNIEDERLNMTVAISMLQIYMNMKEKSVKTATKIDNVIDQYMVKNFLLYHTLSSSIKDKPASTIDFKRALLQVFRTGKLHTDLDSVAANVTRAKMFKLLSNYLYIFDKEYGERIMAGEFFKKGEVPWNDEVRFLNEMEQKIKTGDKTSTSFIDSVAMTMLKNMPDALSDRIEGHPFPVTMEEVFEELEGHEYKYEYRPAAHADCMFSALKYYTHVIAPDSKKKLLEKK
jgi:hypothetical protein